MKTESSDKSDVVQETLEFWDRQTRLLGTRDPLEVLSSTPTFLGHLTHGLLEGLLSAHLIPEKWSIREIVMHLADMEWVFGFRIRTILGDPEPVMMPVDQAAWAVRLASEERTTSRCLETFSLLRNLNVELWKGLSDDDLERRGLHQETGVRLSLGRIRGIQAGHDLSHLAQIEERLRLLQAG